MAASASPLLISNSMSMSWASWAGSFPIFWFCFVFVGIHFPALSREREPLLPGEEEEGLVGCTEARWGHQRWRGGVPEQRGRGCSRVERGGLQGRTPFRSQGDFTCKLHGHFNSRCC